MTLPQQSARRSTGMYVGGAVPRRRRSAVGRPRFDQLEGATIETKLLPWVCGQREMPGLRNTHRTYVGHHVLGSIEGRNGEPSKITVDGKTAHTCSEGVTLSAGPQ
jgi:hypothetical protein